MTGINQKLKQTPFPNPDNYKFSFVDLFAGIGGIRLALHGLGGKCLFSSEWDKYAQITYQANFGEEPHGDITKINEKDIPEHDLLAAGFPCQAFSIAGKRGGFKDTRGTLFFEVARIIKEKQPKAIFLENVKGLINHNRGKTLEVILDTLRNDLNYFVPTPQIVNSKYFGVPQNRERVFIVGFRKDLGITEFSYPEQKEITTCLRGVLEETSVSEKYFISQQYLNTLRKHKSRHESKGNGFGYQILDYDGIANAIVVGGMGRERNLIVDMRGPNISSTLSSKKGQINSDFVRVLTPREWARLQGFPDDFLIAVSDTQAYKQFGNSVAIPAVKATAEKVISLIS